MPQRPKGKHVQNPSILKYELPLPWRYLFALSLFVALGRISDTMLTASGCDQGCVRGPAPDAPCELPGYVPPC